MDSNAIQLIQDTAIAAQKGNRIDTNTPAILLRDSDGRQHVQSLEAYDACRSRFRGTFATSSLTDFASYVIARAGGEGFIQPDALAATVIFNLNVNDEGTPAIKGSPSQAGHADYLAQLTLKPSPAYAALIQASRSKFGQKPLIEWLEDWWDYLAADYPEGDATNPGALVNDPHAMRQALTALRKVKVKATGESVHTDKDFGSSRSALEDVEASSDVGLPRGFRFTCQPSDDLDSRVFYLRLGVITSEKEPQFVLRWAKREADVEAIGQNFKAKLLNAIGDKATMLLGTFDPGK